MMADISMSRLSADDSRYQVCQHSAFIYISSSVSIERALSAGRDIIGICHATLSSWIPDELSVDEDGIA